MIAQEQGYVNTGFSARPFSRCYDSQAAGLCQYPCKVAFPGLLMQMLLDDGAADDVAFHIDRRRAREGVSGFSPSGNVTPTPGCSKLTSTKPSVTARALVAR